MFTFRPSVPVVMAALSSVVFGLLAAPPPTIGSSGWTSPTRVSATDFTRGNGADAWIDGMSMAVDANGYVHVALSGMTRAVDGIWYLSNASGRWTTKRVSRPPADSRGRFGHELSPSLAVDSSGAVSITFERIECADCAGPSAEGIFYLTSTSGRWSAARQIVSGTIVDGTWAGGSSLVMRDGSIHLAYEMSGFNPGPVYYATDARGSLSTRRVTGPVMANGGTKLVIDADGDPHVLVLSTSTDDVSQLGYWTAARNRPTFARQAVPIGARNVHGPLVDLDALGNPTVGWTASDNDWKLTGACFTTRRGSTWSARTCLSEAARLVGLQVDPDGVTHLLVVQPMETPAEGWDQFHGRLVYVTNRTGAWTSTPLFQGPVVDAGLGLDPTGRAHVVFVVGGHGRSDGVYYMALR